MNVYLDSSAIVKLFDDQEPLHGYLRDRLVELGPESQFTSMLAFPETLAAFAGKGYSTEDLNRVNGLFLRTWEEDYSKVEMDQDICNVSGILVRTHRDLRLRGADAVHLASALRVGARRNALAVAVFDRILARSCKAEGFALITDPAFGI